MKDSFYIPEDILKPLKSLCEELLSKSNTKPKVLIYAILNQDHPEYGIKWGKATWEKDTFEEEFENLKAGRLYQHIGQMGCKIKLFGFFPGVVCENGEISNIPGDEYVHTWLKRFGYEKSKVVIERKRFNDFIKGFDVDSPNIYKEVFEAIKGITSEKIPSKTKNSNQSITLRPLQKKAVDSIVDAYNCNINKHLLDGCPRSGKNVMFLNIVKEMSFKNIIFLTNFPNETGDTLFRDFEKVLVKEGYIFTKDISEAVSLYKKGSKFLLFQSFQALKGWKIFGGDHDKGSEIMNIKFDFIVQDEAHQGVKTERSRYIIKKISNDNTRHLYLSGTPYNIVGDFISDEITKITYIDMQKEKEKFNNEYPTEINPYNLPTLKFHMVGKILAEIGQLSSNFSFNNFFGNKSKFDTQVAKNIKALFDRLHEDGTNFPFDENNHKKAKHCLILVPSTSAAAALALWMKGRNTPFNQDEVVNITEEDSNFVEKVKESIKNANERGVRSFIITVQRGTIGMTIREIDTVIMMYGEDKSSPMKYIQACFRAVSPCEGKHEVNVYDLHPTRAFGMYENFVRAMKPQDKSNDEHLKEAIETMPVMEYGESGLIPVEYDALMARIAKIIEEKFNSKGFEMLVDDNFALGNFNEDEFEGLDRILSKKDVKAKENKAKKEEKEAKENKPKKETNPKKSKEGSDEDEDKISTNIEEIIKSVQMSMRLIYPICQQLYVEGKDLTYKNLFKLSDDIFDEICICTIGMEISKDAFKKYISYGGDQYAIEKQIKRIKDQFDGIKYNAENDLNAYFNFHFRGNVFKNITNMSVCTPLSAIDRHFEIIKNDVVFDENQKICYLGSKDGMYAIKYIHKALAGKELSDEEFMSKAKSAINNSVFVCSNINDYNRTKINIGFKNIKIIKIELPTDKLKGKKKDSRISEIANSINNSFKMNFNAILTNPPYQDEVGSPIYHYFINIAKDLNPKYISMITPTRWMNGGKGLDGFRNENLKDRRFKKYHNYLNSSDIFPGVDIGGGTGYFLWDKEYNDQCEFTNIENGNKSTSLRYLDDSGDNFIFDCNGLSILNKVKEKSSNFVNEIISTRKPFGLETNFKCNNNLEDGFVKVFLRKNGNVEVKYTHIDNITKNKEAINKYKIGIPYLAPNDVGIGGIILNPIAFIDKGYACTETFMVCIFDIKEEAKNFESYVKTKFFRFMCFIGKSTNKMSKDDYRNVPLQDFTANSDIDWSQSIEYIDKQLYKKYDLNNDEIKLIESKIKIMN